MPHSNQSGCPCTHLEEKSKLHCQLLEAIEAPRLRKVAGAWEENEGARHGALASVQTAAAGPPCSAAEARVQPHARCSRRQPGAVPRPRRRAGSPATAGKAGAAGSPMSHLSSSRRSGLTHVAFEQQQVGVGALLAHLSHKLGWLPVPCMGHTVGGWRKDRRGSRAAQSHGWAAERQARGAGSRRHPSMHARGCPGGMRDFT